MSQRVCDTCGAMLVRHSKHSRVQWASKRFCSTACGNKARSTHGLRHTRLYNVWAAIKTRCFNPNDKLYQYYGARGITMHPAWCDDFAVFAAYVGADPGKGWDVGRIDNDLGYVPGNVEWQTETKNARNKRTTFWVDYKGRRMSLIEAAELAGVPYKRVWQRIKRDGLTVEDALR